MAVKGVRPVAETARVYAELSEQGVPFGEIAARLGIKPESLRGALRRYEQVTGEEIPTRLVSPKYAKLRAELSDWYRSGCPL